MKNIINYSQSWEDPVILREAFNISKDDVVLSITSGGDNTLALLLQDPQKIVSVDMSSAQNYLLELKKAAIAALEYGEFVRFIGVEKAADRFALFNKCKQYMNTDAYAWWLHHRSLVERGIIHTGKFERYINTFGTYVLPFIHSKKTINEFIKLSSIEEQRTFYANRWNSKKWKMYFRLSSHPFILNRFARQKEMSSQTTITNVAHNYLERLEKNLNTMLISENYFMQYCLTGTYGKTLPPYIQEKHFTALKKSVRSSLYIETENVLDYLQSKPAKTFTKYNLSDIFEALPHQVYETLWHEIIRTAKKNAVVAYWNNLVTRPVPRQFHAMLREEKDLSAKLSRQDKVFFYEGFHVYTILK